MDKEVEYVKYRMELCQIGKWEKDKGFYYFPEGDNFKLENVVDEEANYKFLQSKDVSLIQILYNVSPIKDRCLNQDTLYKTIRTTYVYGDLNKNHYTLKKIENFAKYALQILFKQRSKLLGRSESDFDENINESQKNISELKLNGTEDPGAG